MYLEPKCRLAGENRIAAANGIIEMTPGKPSRILVSNFSDRTFNLYKGTTVAYATRSPIVIKEVPTKVGQELAHSILAIPSEAMLSEEET